MPCSTLLYLHLLLAAGRQRRQSFEIVTFCGSCFAARPRARGCKGAKYWSVRGCAFLTSWESQAGKYASNRAGLHRQCRLSLLAADLRSTYLTWEACVRMGGGSFHLFSLIT